MIYYSIHRRHECFSGSDLKLLEHRANDWLCQGQNWLLANDIALNVSNPKFIIFRPKNKAIDLDVKLKTEKVELAATNSCRFLGVWFRFDRSWSDPVDYLRIRISRCLGLIRRLSFTPAGQKTATLFFNSLQADVLPSNMGCLL